MNPLEYIALASALLRTIAEASQALGSISNALYQSEEMTAEERKAFEELLGSDHAKSYWQPND